MKPELKLGLIGAGFIGGSHALAVSAVNRVFAEVPLQAIPAVLVDANEDLARRSSQRFGFNRWTTDWHEAVASCDAVIIAVPSFLHREIALAAIEMGRHVLCEKPVGLSSSEADDIAEAARQAGVSNAVGFTYRRAPLVRQAKRLLDSGTLGAPLHFRGWHNEDYLADPQAPFSWRLDASLAGRCGALGDLGWHILSIARFLCGPVAAVCGSVSTFHGQRPVAGDPSTMRVVENEDWAGLSLRFASGAVGLVEVSRVAHGRKMGIAFELVCENGTIIFDGERLNEVEVFRQGADGFERMLINADHPDYGAFIPAPGHGLGFNDLKTIELRDFMQAIVSGENADPDLNEAVRIARICEAAIDSSQSNCWIEAPEG